MMDMTQFNGSNSSDQCNHGIRGGTLVIEYANKTNPEMAQLLFWFNAPLENDGTATHLLRMDGTFQDPHNWPPAPGTSSIVEFHFWEFFAENKKARRQDCAGESDFLGYGERIFFAISQVAAAQ